MIRISVVILITFIFLSELKAQNYVPFSSNDSKSDIIRKAANVVPTTRQLRWQQLEVTGFFHFGVNTFTGQEWGNGKESPNIFNPTQLNVNQWVKAAKDGGIKQVIITAKHHDGFCLWPSEYTEHSVKNSPWKNGKGDVVAEVAKACKKEKIGFGVYLSPWDRNAPSYGTSAYNDYFANQLTELLTKYGKVDEVWFDGANGEGANGKKQDYDFNRWYKLIRKLQPQAVIAIMGPDVRWVGTETGYGRETEWSVVPASNLGTDAIAESSQKAVLNQPQGYVNSSDIGSREKLYASKGAVWYPAETDVSIRPGWFYHKEEDSKVKTPEKLLDIYFNSIGKNGVLLLNIPPDKRGLLHENDVNTLKTWREKIDAIFKDNLLHKSRLTSNQAKNLKALTDGKNTTYCTTNDQDTTMNINFDFDQAITFDVLSLQEYIKSGQRVESFVLEYLAGDTWIKATSGTTIGYKRLLAFNPVTAKKLRLRILSSRFNPMIMSAGLYKQP